MPCGMKSISNSLEKKFSMMPGASKFPGLTLIHCREKRWLEIASVRRMISETSK